MFFLFLFFTKSNRWSERVLSADHISTFRHHALPLARIKKIMKTDEDVKVRFERYLDDLYDYFSNWISSLKQLARLCDVQKRITRQWPTITHNHNTRWFRPKPLCFLLRHANCSFEISRSDPGSMQRRISEGLCRQAMSDERYPTMSNAFLSIWTEPIFCLLTSDILIPDTVFAEKRYCGCNWQSGRIRLFDWYCSSWRSEEYTPSRTSS